METYQSKFRCIECGSLVLDIDSPNGLHCPICKYKIDKEKEIEKKSILTVDIKSSALPVVKDSIKKANEKINNQQKLLESYARIVDGMISDATDIRERLINVLDDLEVANTTVRLEEHDESLKDAIKSVAYLIDFLSNIGDED